MATYSPAQLSNSDGGRPIVLDTNPQAGTVPGTPLHTVPAGAVDEVYLYASNRNTVATTLTVEWGGITAADHIVESYSLPPTSASIQITQGQRLNAGKKIGAFASVTGVVLITGVVNRINL